MSKRNTCLTLTRKRGEAITLALPSGARIWVIVKDVERGMARLVIDAPPEVVIARDELLVIKEVEPCAS